MSCGTCHHACECREQKVAAMIKAALDAAAELDWLKNGIAGVSKSPDDDRERRERCSQIVERVYNACEPLGVVLGASDGSALEEELYL
jgi:hypothetical protein